MTTRSKLPAALILALAALGGSALLAQVQTGALWREDFQSYRAQASPASWREYRVGELLPFDGHAFRIGEDPSAAANLVYRSLAQRQHVVIRERDVTAGRAGNFSLFDHQFFLTGRQQIHGRIMTAGALGGITFLSSYPERDQYYLIGTWQRDEERTFRLFAHGGANLSGQIESDFEPEQNRWYRFRIEVAEQGGGLEIRARLWADGTPEPVTYSIDAVDHSLSRPRSGRVGVWAVGGGVHFDDLGLDSALDASRLTIQVLESGIPTGDGAKFNRDVSFEIRAIGPDSPTATATLDGQPYVNGTMVRTEGPHVLVVEARNLAGDTASARIGFLIDKTPPRIRFTSHQSGSVLRSNRVVLTGDADDAVQLLVNSVLAVIDAQGRFISSELALQEGPNTIVAVGVDAVGNTGRAEIVLIVNTGAVPQISIASPAASSCLDTTSLSVTGTAAAATGVTVTFGAVTVPATLHPDGSWQATFSNPPEHRGLLVAEARNDSGAAAAASVLLTVDRTPPIIEVTEGGAPFTAAAINRAVAPFFRVVDLDPAATLTVTSGGNPFVSGTSITAEGVHRLDAVGRDCAGHETRRTIEFTIDLTAPSLQNLTPVNDATVSASPLTIRGTTSTDVARVEIAGTALRATPDPNGSFAIADVPLSEGLNTFTLRAIDHAGNVAEAVLRVRYQTRGPGLEILVNGSTLVSGTLFNRPIEPVIRSFDSTATVTVTLNGAAFTSGSRVSADGPYELIATATDSVGNSTREQASFTIDATPPVVKITSPSGTVAGDRTDVSGTAGDSVSVLVNGIPARLENGNFVATGVLLDFEETVIDAVGYDRAGNAGRDSVTVRRQVPGPAIVILHPSDGSLTNRSVTEIVGQVLTDAVTITIGSSTLGKVGTMATTVPVDASGRFQLSNFPLSELENAITATATSPAGSTSSATIRVVADFTPPALTVLESGQPFGDGGRVPERAVLSLDARDPYGPLRTELIVDGITAAELPVTISTPGGHTLVAIARDAAGNQTRLEQSFFVGSGAAAGCALGGFDPPDGAVVTASQVTLVGLSGGVAGVKVNGVSASVASGSFCATIELPAEGANAVSITCTDASGNPTGTPALLTLVRMTNDPTVTIDSPPEGGFVGTETIGVTGSAGAGALSVEVNGAAAALGSGSPAEFTAPSVRLNSGLNLIIARARNSASRTSTATRRVIYLKDAPAITVTSPRSSNVGGTERLDVSGTWANLDPATIAVSGPGGAATTIQTRTWSDTTGSFRAVDVPLISGTQTITVTGRDQLSRFASANVMVTYTSGAPSIEITQPLDNQTFGAAAGETFEVRGSFRAQPGATVEVNGVVATIDASRSTFVAPVRFSTSVPLTPVVARVTEPGGAVATDVVRFTKLMQSPRVFEVFPAAGATEMDAASLITVLFSTPMSRESLAGGFRLENAGGAPVSGVSWLDRDLLMFAPGAPLSAGEPYTIRITPAATDPGGNVLSAEFASSFTVARAAASNAPVLEPVASPVCAETITIRGSAAPLSRLRLEAGPLMLATTADAGGSFSFQYPTGGRSGCQVARIRSVAADGSLSAAVEARFFVDCAGPGVLAAQFDRATNRLELTFSKPLKASTICVGSTCSIRLRSDDGSIAGGTVEVSGANVTVTPAVDLRSLSFTLTVTTAVEDTDGRAMRSDFTQRFAFGSSAPQPGDGSGFISGEVFDGTSGRPFAGATVTVEIPASSGARSLLDVQTMETLTTTTDERGRYTLRLPEGAHTIRISAPGFAPIWRQVIVPAGGGVVPVDIRIPRRGASSSSTGAAITLADGAETPVTTRVELTVPASSLTPGQSVSLTSTGAQELAGLLPPGWSPLAAAEVDSDSSTLAGAQLVFTVPYQEIVSATQTLSGVRYDRSHDEWVVLVPAVSIGSDGRAVMSIDAPGSFALVYADRGPRLAQPPAPVGGGVLVGVESVCEGACQLVSRTFAFDPPVIPPTGRSVATLIIEGSDAAIFPSGTAVQAYIDEELRLADGTRIVDPPYATDLILYRTLAGDAAVARFHLAPSPRAGAVILDVGYSRVRIVPYPGRVDRGNLVGPEGGRAHDAKVMVEVPPGAANEAIRVGAASLSDADLQAAGPIAGFRVVAGLQLELVRVDNTPVDSDNDGVPDAPRPVELLRPALAVFSVDETSLPSPSAQMIVVEVIGSAPMGTLFRLVAQADRGATQSAGTTRVITRAIDRTRLPLDGIRREGRYLLLAAESPIALAFGALRLGQGGAYLPDARLHAPPLGVNDVTRIGGFFLVPVPARPAAPFSLLARHANHGEAAPFAATVAPEPDAILNLGDLVFTVQPPTITSTSPSDGATEVALTTSVRVTFSPAIDPSTVDAESLVVRDAESAQAVRGNVAAEGTAAVVWTLRPGEQLEANRRYLVTISRTIRGANGAALGETQTFGFATITRLSTAEVRRDRIRITIPDDQGVSRVTGSAGALPPGWVAIAVRLGRDFLTQYQGAAAGDGSFGFGLGGGVDRIGIEDSIDLRIVNTAGNVAAIIPLTPFTSVDGRGFVPETVCRAKDGQCEPTRFTSADGISITVPHGAFDAPTVITVAPEKEEAFAEVPAFDQSVNLAAAVRLDFDATRANKPLEVELPVPPGMQTANRYFFLGLRGESVRGPRIMAVDTLRVIDGKFTTVSRSSSGKARSLRSNSIEPDENLSRYMLRSTRSGVYGAMDVNPSAGSTFGWVMLDGLLNGFDIFWSSMASFYAADYYIAESNGRIVIPALTNTPFEIVGVDSSTGLQAFTRVYNPLAPGDPGATVSLPNPQQNTIGPYPAFGTPFRVEVLDLQVENIDITSIRGYTVRLENGMAKVTPASGPRVELLNVSRGYYHNNSGAEPVLSVNAQLGDRIVLLIPEMEVDPNANLTIVFSEPIFTGTSPDPFDIQVYLEQKIALETRQPNEPLFTNITKLVDFQLDSGGRRLSLVTRAPWRRGNIYRLRLKKDLSDIGDGGVAGLKLVQVGELINGTLQPVGDGHDLQVEFRIREPKGFVSQFGLRQSSSVQFGTVRDLALNGNLLFIAAHEGGLLAYDVADPASLSESTLPLAMVPGRDGDAPALTENWGVASDHHGRVYTTGITASFGVLRSYRIEDFLNAAQTPTNCWSIPNTVCQPVGGTAISWRIGATAGLPLSSATVVSDLPEALPRKLQIALQDNEVTLSGTTFDSASGATAVGVEAGGLLRYSYSAPIDDEGIYPYRIQRITIENMDLDMRWSGDARPGQPALIHGILLRPSDRVRIIRNQRTWAVVSLFGYGISVMDLNALESNDQPGVTTRISERLALTRARAETYCFLAQEAPAPCAIPGLAFSPEALIRTHGTDLMVYGLDPARGVLDVSVVPPFFSEALGGVVPARVERAAKGLLFTNPYTLNGQIQYEEWDRIAQLRTLYENAPGNPEKRRAQPRFSSIARYNWRLEAEQNRLGIRGSEPGKTATRDYALIAGNDFGLLVVETFGNPPPLIYPSYWGLRAEHIVDLIWIPAGAMSVRTIPRTNLAVVVDGRGEVLLVDLSRIDERWRPDGTLMSTEAIFPTAFKALTAPEDFPDQVGLDDPRIIWRSGHFIGRQTTPPLIDPDTGFIFAGTDRVMKVFSAVDPRIQMKVDLGGPAGMVEVGGVVPLGIDPPKDIQKQIALLPPCPPPSDAPVGVPRCRENASLAAFRLEVTLPGALADVLTQTGQQLRVALENERVLGAVTAQTPAGFPRAHLRQRRADGSFDPRAPNGFTMQRLVPPSMASQLRHQRGFNKFVSPWIVAIADPRASVDYLWPQDTSAAAKLDAGCPSCDRPLHLRGKTEADGVFELWSAGRILLARPDSTTGGNIFTGTPYVYLGEGQRLVARYGTIMADTVRPSDDPQIARQLPMSGGMMEQMVHVHTGEVQSAATDLAIQARGIDFVLTRVFSSGVFAFGPLGRNFDSPLFSRVRKNPDGTIDYFDGTGRKDSFRTIDGARYFSKPEIFIDLFRREDGHVVITPDQTKFYFDLFGRLRRIVDRNRLSQDGSDGNSMEFLYGRSGLLASVVDPIGREIRFEYDGADRLSRVVDFDGREVKYQYDSLGRLVEVKGPDPESALSEAPVTTYSWNTPQLPSELKQWLYRSSQLASERDGEGRTVYMLNYSSEPWRVLNLNSGGGTWTLNYQTGATQVIDPRGLPTTFTYDTTGRVTQITDPGSAVTKFAFDLERRLQETIQPRGEKTSFTYQPEADNGNRRGMGNLTEIVQHPRPDSSEESAGLRRVTRIKYNKNNFPVEIENPDGSKQHFIRDERGNPIAVLDATGVTTQYVFNKFGQIAKVTDPRTGVTQYAYEESDPKRLGYPIKVAAASGVTQIETDLRGNVIKVIDPGGRSVVYGVNRLDQVETENRGGSSTSTRYDSTGAVVSTSTLAGSGVGDGPIFSVTNFEVDELGRVRTQTVNGITTTYQYDAAGNVVQVSSPASPPVQYTYDSVNRISTMTVGNSVTSYAYNENGDSTSVTNARGKITSFVLDGFGRSSGQIDPLGLQQINVSDPAGRPVESLVIKTRADGTRLLLRWTQREYDVAGRLIKEVRKLFDQPLIIPQDGSDPVGAADVTQQFEHDDQNRRSKAIDPRGVASLTEFDEMGRPQRQVDGVGNVVEFFYDASGNRVGEVIREVGAEGMKEQGRIVYEYDEESRLIALSDVSDPRRPLTTRYQYDSRGQRTRIIDPEGNETRIEYDLKGRRVEDIDPEGGTTSYSYDDADRLIAVVDPNDNQTQFNNDAQGNLTQEMRADGSAWHYAYDENNNLKTITDANGTITTLTYDDADRLIQKQIGPTTITYVIDDLGRILSAESSEGVKETFSYDSLDRQTSQSIHLPGGSPRTVKRTYDAAGNRVSAAYPSGLELSYGIDPLGRISSIESSRTPVVQYADAGLRMVSKSLANGITETWSYDSNRRLQEIASPGRQIRYERSPAGNKSSILRLDLGTKSTYRHNRNSWITQEALGFALDDPKALPAVVTDYGIDPTLNYGSITRNDVRIDTTVNSRNQYASFGGDGLTYDRNGNLTSFRGKRVQYDAANLPRQVSLLDGTRIETLYTPSGRKVQEKLTFQGTTRTTDYALDGDRVTEEYVNGQLAARYIHGRGIDEIVRAEQSTALDGKLDRVIYPLQDELGNVERLTDSSGSTLARFEYEGYGNFSVFPAEATFDWKWLFQGREYNSVTNTYDFRARTLWPELGRFGQEDPSGTKDSLNQYQSFLGNWLNNTDPDGRLTVVIHGTWASGTKPFLPGGDLFLAVQSTVNDPVVVSYQWSGADDFQLRDHAGRMLAYRLKRYKFSPGETLNLIGHSHGGNVAIAAINDRPYLTRSVNNLVTLATPVRDDYQIINRALIENWVNFYNLLDEIQVRGGSSSQTPYLPRIKERGRAGRTFRNARNARVVFEGRVGGVEAHSKVRSPDVWFRYVLPTLRVPNIPPAHIRNFVWKETP